MKLDDAVTIPHTVSTRELKLMLLGTRENMLNI
jgi:hypothetical protein